MNNEKHILSLIDSLNERTKELNCIYQVEEVLKYADSNLEDIFEKLLEIIPTGWQYSAICKARILFEDLVFEPKGFKKTELKLSANIVVENKIIGEIQVYYIEPIRLEKGIFLVEERRLLKTIAEKINNYIAYKKLRDSYNKEKDSTEKRNIVFNKQVSTITDWLMGMKLSDKEIKELCRIKLVFKKGETVCKQGAFSSYIMLLTEGYIKTYVESIQDRNFNIKIVKPIDFIGLSSLLGNNYYHFSAKALCSSTIWLIEKEIFNKVLSNNKEFAFEVMKYYCNNYELIYKKFSCIGTKQALGRIADVLLYLSKDIFNGSINSNIISRKDIAEFAGISTESTVRFLTDLKKDGIIKITNTSIEIIKTEILERISIAG